MKIKKIGLERLISAISIRSRSTTKDVYKKNEINKPTVYDERSQAIELYGPTDCILKFKSSPVLLTPLSVCAHIHLYHVELADDICRFLSNIPMPFTLLLSIHGGEDVVRWQKYFTCRLPKINRCIVKSTVNRGRDALPWIVLFKNEILEHDLLLHVHSKQSSYNPALGSWRSFLLHHVLGSIGIVSDIYRLFVGQRQLGLVYPPYFGELREQPQWGANKEKTKELLERLNINNQYSACPDFPAGSFFWCRTEMISPLLNLGISEDDFEEEEGQIDGTLAHAIERLLGILGETGGFKKLCVATDIPYDSPALPHSLALCRSSNQESESTDRRQVLVSAFYLPQFYPFEINNINWGEGFTEWFNVARGQPRFREHFQPKLPGILGFYDLRLPLIHEQQIKLAREHGVSNFCMYYYRFGNTRLMDEPVRVFRDIDQGSVSYCYCWANEDWTRAWDGTTSEVILEQTYDRITLDGLILDLVDAIQGRSYQFIGNKPVFMIYQVAAIPDPGAWINEVRERVKEQTGLELIVGTVFSNQFTIRHLDYVDFVVQFPPHRMPRSSGRPLIPASKLLPFEAHRSDFYESYFSVMDSALDRPNLLSKMLMGVCPDWDNAPRRQSKAHTLVGSTPYDFQSWVREARKTTLARYDEGSIIAPMLFVNAWNEWAEGAILEPSAQYGRMYLEALKAGLE